MLTEVYANDAESKTKYPNLELGGQTATAYIYRNGKYRRKFHSSFYGFVNDNEGNKYTIGVLLIRPKDVKRRAGSKSSFSVFGDVVDVMVEEKWLNLD